MITFLIGVAVGFMLAVLNFIWLFFENKAENKRNSKTITNNNKTTTK